ncbi:MAG: hypothetical protein HFG15_00560 [Bacilli bacterium]|jgi:hypothetical protein|nr:hypothetical protein [Bacilli bacterium]
MSIWSDIMILLAVSNTELTLFVMIGLLIVALIGFGIIRYTKMKMERELDALSTEASIQEEEIVTKNTSEQIEVAIPESPEADLEFAEVEQDTEEHLSEIEVLLEKMQSDLEKQDRDIVHTFEEEQEEKSIISYQELKAMKEKQSHEKEIMKYEREQEQYSDLDAVLEAGKLDEPSPKNSKSVTTTFSNSDFISPVYGKIETGELDYPKIPNFKEEFHIDHNREEIIFDDVKVKLRDDEPVNLEHTFDLGPISEEIKKNDEFLKALKEFRNNLE